MHSTHTQYTRCIPICTMHATRAHTYISSTVLETHRGTFTYTTHTTPRVHTTSTNTYTHPLWLWTTACVSYQQPIFQAAAPQASPTTITIHLVHHHPQNRATVLTEGRDIQQGLSSLTSEAAPACSLSGPRFSWPSLLQSSLISNREGSAQIQLWLSLPVSQH